LSGISCDTGSDRPDCARIQYPRAAQRGTHARRRAPPDWLRTPEGPSQSAPSRDGTSVARVSLEIGRRRELTL